MPALWFALKLSALLAWSAFAFWVFSFSFSSSFFEYNLASRLAPFVAAAGGAIALPVVAFRQWYQVQRASRGPLKAWLLHCVGAVCCVLPLVLVAAIQKRLPEPWHLSGDDAMGVGIDFLLLTAGAIVSGLTLGAALLARQFIRSRRFT